MFHWILEVIQSNDYIVSAVTAQRRKTHGTERIQGNFGQRVD